MTCRAEGEHGYLGCGQFYLVQEVGIAVLAAEHCSTLEYIAKVCNAMKAERSSIAEYCEGWHCYLGICLPAHRLKAHRVTLIKTLQMMMTLKMKKAGGK